MGTRLDRDASLMHHHGHILLRHATKQPPVSFGVLLQVIDVADKTPKAAADLRLMARQPRLRGGLITHLAGDSNEDSDERLPP